MPGNRQTNQGRKSLVIGVSVLAGGLLAGILLFTFLRSSSPDIWAPFILFFYGFAGIAFFASIVGLFNGIVQVSSEKKAGDKPSGEAVAGIVLNGMMVSLPLISLVCIAIRSISWDSQEPEPVVVPPTPAVSVIQSQSTQNAIQSSAEGVIHAYLETVIFNDWNSARLLIDSPDTNDRDAFTFGVERCLQALASGYELNAQSTIIFMIYTYNDACEAAIIVHLNGDSYFIENAHFSVRP